MKTHHFTKREVWADKTSLTQPLLLYRSACTKPGKCAVMYLCVRCIDFASFYDFDFGIVQTLWIILPHPPPLFFYSIFQATCTGVNILLNLSVRCYIQHLVVYILCAIKYLYSQEDMYSFVRDIWCDKSMIYL